MKLKIKKILQLKRGNILKLEFGNNFQQSPYLMYSKARNVEDNLPTLTFNSFDTLAQLQLPNFENNSSNSSKNWYDNYAINSPIQPTTQSTTQTSYPINGKINMNSVLKEFENWRGTKYKYGGNNKSGIDCSAFIGQLVSNTTEIKLPRTAEGMRTKAGTKIGINDVQPGDLVFLKGTNPKKAKGSATHVAMVESKNTDGSINVLESSSSKGVVKSKWNVQNSGSYHGSKIMPDAVRLA